ncbi:MAG TPA: hypothetical protein DF966_04300 [Sulfitobacter sp.]|nr:hypothetical protein [Sulfitobacter sp.]|tara:strand:- start:127 stop:345 length:219 start_codon:yes stop_codon:yes gene_type:complete
MDTFDLPSFIEAYGLPGFIIIALVWVVRALWTRLNEQVDARFEDHKAHTSQMADNTKTLDAALRYIEGKGRD